MKWQSDDPPVKSVTGIGKKFIVIETVTSVTIIIEEESISVLGKLQKCKIKQIQN